MTRLIIPTLCLLACVIGCSSSAAFDPVGTWVYDFAASSADPANAGHTEDLEDMRDANITFTLAADSTGMATENNRPIALTYVITDTGITITAGVDGGKSLAFTIQGQHLTMTEPDSQTELPVFYFSKQP